MESSCRDWKEGIAYAGGGFDYEFNTHLENAAQRNKNLVISVERRHGGDIGSRMHSSFKIFKPESLKNLSDMNADFVRTTYETDIGQKFVLRTVSRLESYIDTNSLSES